MYGCKIWTVKKAEPRRTDAFELWCWRGLLRVPWTATRSNQSILKEISPECSLEGLMLKLKLQYFGHLMGRTGLFEKTLMLGKIEGRRRRGRSTEDEMVGWHHWLNGHGFGWTPGVGDGQGGLACCGSWGRKELDTTERLNWTELSDKILEKDIEALRLLLRRHSVKAKKPEHWLTFCQKNIILLLNLAVDQPQGSMACNLVTGHPHIRVSSNRKFLEDRRGGDLGCKRQKNQ